MKQRIEIMSDVGPCVAEDRLKELNEKLIKLEQFYQAVADLTLRHDVLNGYAVVYPSNLGPLLESVNSEWWKR